jgi:hypothetical protein
MNVPCLKLREIERKYRRREALSIDELEFATAALTSPSVQEKIIGCEAVFREDSLSQFRTRATETLETICKDALETGAGYPPNLVYALLRVPQALFAASQVIREFGFLAANSQNAGCRMNSVLVLERLANLGDKGAEERLRKIVDDSDALVRANAAKSLDRLRNGINVERALV